MILSILWLSVMVICFNLGKLRLQHSLFDWVLDLIAFNLNLLVRFSPSFIHRKCCSWGWPSCMMSQSKVTSYPTSTAEETETRAEKVTEEIWMNENKYKFLLIEKRNVDAKIRLSLNHWNESLSIGENCKQNYVKTNILLKSYTTHWFAALFHNLHFLLHWLPRTCIAWNVCLYPVY